MDPDVVAARVVRRVLGHAGRKREAEPALQLGEEPLARPAVAQEEELQPSLLAALAELVAVAEQLGDRLDHREHLVRPHEGVQPRAEARIGGETAAHAQREAGLAGAGMAERGQRDVVDLRRRAPRRGSR